MEEIKNLEKDFLETINILEEKLNRERETREVYSWNDKRAEANNEFAEKTYSNDSVGELLQEIDETTDPNRRSELIEKLNIIYQTEKENTQKEIDSKKEEFIKNYTKIINEKIETRKDEINKMKAKGEKSVKRQIEYRNIKNKIKDTKNKVYIAAEAENQKEEKSIQSYIRRIRRKMREISGYEAKLKEFDDKYGVTEKRLAQEKARREEEERKIVQENTMQEEKESEIEQEKVEQEVEENKVEPDEVEEKDVGLKGAEEHEDAVIMDKGEDIEIKNMTKKDIEDRYNVVYDIMTIDELKRAYQLIDKNKVIKLNENEINELNDLTQKYNYALERYYELQAKQILSPEEGKILEEIEKLIMLEKEIKQKRTVKPEEKKEEEYIENTEKDKKELIDIPITVNYIARTNKYYVKGNTEKDSVNNVYERGKELKITKEQIAQKYGMELEALRNVDSKIYEMLLKFDEQNNTNKADKYVEKLTQMGRNKEQRKSDMKEIGIDITYKLQGLISKKYSKEKRREILDVANRAKKLGIANVEKGLRVTIMDFAGRIGRSIKSIFSKKLLSEKEATNMITDGKKDQVQQKENSAEEAKRRIINTINNDKNLRKELDAREYVDNEKAIEDASKSVEDSKAQDQEKDEQTI